MSNKKQNSIEQKVFKSSLDLLLYYLPSAIRGQFKEQIEKAKAMHNKEVISFAKKCLDKALDTDVRTAHSKVEELYNETFGGEQC